SRRERLRISSSFSLCTTTGPTSGSFAARRSRTSPTRIMKNSSRLFEQMLRNFTRSSNGTSGFSASPSTRRLNASQLNSRSKGGELQELLFAEHKHKLLVVLQGMDTSGKDGTVRHVMRGVSPAAVRVASFKKPTQPELEHDFLWRVHAQAPAVGEIVIFNRSHYEDVLIVRVHELVPEKVWHKRYDQINAFERTLTESGTTVLNFFLHIRK